jgi:hypothetical protein
MSSLKLLTENGYKAFVLSLKVLGVNYEIQITNFHDVFSLSIVDLENESREETMVANRYRCNTSEELEFLLMKGRVGLWLLKLDAVKVILN